MALNTIAHSIRRIITFNGSKIIFIIEVFFKATNCIKL